MMFAVQFEKTNIWRITLILFLLLTIAIAFTVTVIIVTIDSIIIVFTYILNATTIVINIFIPIFLQSICNRALNF
jgi:hypothetical protein